MGTKTKGCGKQQRKQPGKPGGNDPETQKRKKNRDTGETIGAGKEGNNLERQGETIDATSQETTGMLGETKRVTRRWEPDLRVGGPNPPRAQGSQPTQEGRQNCAHFYFGRCLV